MIVQLLDLNGFVELSAILQGRTTHLTPSYRSIERTNEQKECPSFKMDMTAMGFTATTKSLD